VGAAWETRRLLPFVGVGVSLDMPQQLKAFLALQTVGAKEAPVYYQMDPTLPMAYIVGPDRSPVKLQSRVRIEVPMHVWDSPEEELAAIVHVMAYMAERLPLTVSGPKAITRAFWTRLATNLKACVCNPELKGKFFIPERTAVVFSEALPANRILCLGLPRLAGTLLARDSGSGYVLPIQSGVTAIRLSSTA